MYLNSTNISKHSWYFRNALVRANYKNAVKGIDYSPVYLERFFRNLLLGEKWDLCNRYLHINPTNEWNERPNLSPQKTTETTTEKTTEKILRMIKDNPKITNKELAKACGRHLISPYSTLEKKYFLRILLPLCHQLNGTALLSTG